MPLSFFFFGHSCSCCRQNAPCFLSVGFWTRGMDASCSVARLEMALFKPQGSCRGFLLIFFQCVQYILCSFLLTWSQVRAVVDELCRSQAKWNTSSLFHRVISLYGITTTWWPVLCFRCDCLFPTAVGTICWTYLLVEGGEKKSCGAFSEAVYARLLVLERECLLLVYLERILFPGSVGKYLVYFSKCHWSFHNLRFLFVVGVVFCCCFWLFSNAVHPYFPDRCSTF